MAHTKQSEQSLPVIIIGAGAAGLTAAQELQTAGHDYLILEGRDRIGGRIHTHQEPMAKPTLFELGAAWFHDVPHNRLAFAAEEEGYEAKYDDEQTVLFDDEGALDVPSFSDIASKFDEYRFRRDEGKTLDEVSANFLGELSKAEEKRVALAYVNLLSFFAGVPPTHVGAHFKKSDGRDQAVQGGYIKLFENLLTKDVDPRRVKLSTKVTHITTPKEGDQVRVSTQDGQHFDGKGVIVTVPVGTLKSNNRDHIQFEPRLNGNLIKSIESTPVVHVDKVYLTFPSTFWDQQVYKWVVTDSTSPAVVWNWTATHPGTSQLNTVAVLVTNSVAKQVQSQPGDAFEIVKPILRNVTGAKDIPEPTQVVLSSWDSDEFSLGAFTSVELGQTREELAAPFIHGEPQNRLFFAGEHATVEGAGLVQGAWESGKRAAKQVIDANL